MEMQSRHMDCWQFASGDWYHIEVDPAMCNDPELAKQAWDKVFGVIPAITKNPV
jgi:hypothetical protein